MNFSVHNQSEAHQRIFRPIRLELMAPDQVIAGSRGTLAAGSLKVARFILGVTGYLVSRADGPQFKLACAFCSALTTLLS